MSNIYSILPMYEASFTSGSFIGERVEIGNKYGKIELVREKSFGGKKSCLLKFDNQEFYSYCIEKTLDKFTTTNHQGHIIPQNLIRIVCNKLTKKIKDEIEKDNKRDENQKIFKDINSRSSLLALLNRINGIPSWVLTIVNNDKLIGFDNNVNCIYKFVENDVISFINSIEDIITWCPLNICAAPIDATRAGYPKDLPDMEVIMHILRDKKYNNERYKKMIEAFTNSGILLWLFLSKSKYDKEENVYTFSYDKLKDFFKEIKNLFYYYPYIIISEKTKLEDINALDQSLENIDSNNAITQAEAIQGIISILGKKGVAKKMGDSILRLLNKMKEKNLLENDNWSDTARKLINTSITDECIAYIESFIQACCDTLVYITDDNYEDVMGYYAFEWALRLRNGNLIYHPSKSDLLNNPNRVIPIIIDPNIIVMNEPNINLTLPNSGSSGSTKPKEFHEYVIKHVT